uniref:DUF4139 domain-containing protein n=1 Tax=Altererythrobacter segetis TaxID=1104773 RepID=UPI0014083B3E|nr:hypothetical protein [Altererythrobacter segetis]
MRRAALLLFAALWAMPAAAREVVDASAPKGLAVTLYRDPNRGEGQAMNRDWPQGFAMISETRQVTLPPGESTIRFEGVAEGMVAVTAIVTGLPGGTIEKNRNADLLSPGALVDGTLGNRVTITRTNPATGEARSESAIVRTRADGGLVLQTGQGFEAVRCSGLPEKLTFDRVPAGLSAQPVFTVDTRSPAGGTYAVTLTYLAWGFDWQAHYVATVDEGSRGDVMRLRLMSWLTLLNDNGQSFPDAELMAVAGRLNVTSDYRSLADPPDAKALSLVCYPIGRTADGSPVEAMLPPPPPPPPTPPMAERGIVVTAQRLELKTMDSAAPMVAVQEELGDLKLYRVPEHVTVAAKGLKQVAFLDKDAVRGKLVYQADCNWWNTTDEPAPAQMRFETVNDARHGLGAALPMGGITFFEPSSRGDLFVGEQQLRDYAQGQNVEVALGDSAQVFVRCSQVGGGDPDKGGGEMKATLINANPHQVTLRLKLGSPLQWRLPGLSGSRVKDGEAVYEVTIPANGKRELAWGVHQANTAE